MVYTVIEVGKTWDGQRAYKLEEIAIPPEAYPLECYEAARFRPLADDEDDPTEAGSHIDISELTEVLQEEELLI